MDLDPDPTILSKFQVYTCKKNFNILNNLLPISKNLLVAKKTFRYYPDPELARTVDNWPLRS
jgi:hypothetical protein